MLGSFREFHVGDTFTFGKLEEQHNLRHTYKVRNKRFIITESLAHPLGRKQTFKIRLLEHEKIKEDDKYKYDIKYLTEINIDMLNVITSDWDCPHKPIKNICPRKIVKNIKKKNSPAKMIISHNKITFR